MRHFIIAAIALMVCFQIEAVAQRDKMSKAEREAAWRAERLRKRAAEKAKMAEADSIAFTQAVAALQSGSWALEASNITFNNSNINSPNGLGGVTLEGSVWGERMGKDENGNIFYSFSIQGSGISAVVYVTLTAGTNQASASVNANYSGNKMVFNGYLYPYSSAGIFEGQPSY